MLEVGILKESLTFLLIGLLLITVSCNPYFRTIFGSKSLGNKLIRDPKCLGWDTLEGLEIKNEEEEGNIGALRLQST